jgi:hypothetical protein
MTLGEVFLKSVVSGVITEDEIAWVASQQSAFARHEEAVAVRLGRLIDAGQVNLGCRIHSRQNGAGEAGSGRSDGSAMLAPSA